MSRKGASDAVKVMVRVRPFNAKEIGEANEEGLDLPICTVQCPNERTIIAIDHRADVITMEDQETTAAFGFDHVFWSMTEIEAGIPFSGQREVYEKVNPMLDVAFEGYNVSIFAYGQTSSGKTHTMMGGHSLEERGIIPRLCEEIFDKLSNEDRTKVQTTVALSYLEIYNEKIQDLLPLKSGNKKPVSPRNKKAPAPPPQNDTAVPSPRSPRKDGGDLHIYYDPDKGPIVNGLAVHEVDSWRAVQKLLDLGNSNRSTAATQMNDRSSRSHAIVQLTVSRSYLMGVVATKELWKAKHSRINLVDLAGSEKVRKTGVTGQNMKESIGINQSLTCLGRVIDLLCERKQGEHIPYRDSTLTGLLSDSLGGNSRTTMLAALSPAAVNFEETLSTLRYAARARKIVNVVKVNSDPTQALIDQLKEEIKRLRAALPEGSSIEASVKLDELNEISAVENALKKSEGEEEAELARREQEWNSEREAIEQRHLTDIMDLMNQKEHLLKVAEEAKQQAEKAKTKRIAGLFSAAARIGRTDAMLREMSENYQELKKLLGTDQASMFEELRAQLANAERQINSLHNENQALKNYISADDPQGRSLLISLAQQQQQILQNRLSGNTTKSSASSSISLNAATAGSSVRSMGSFVTTEGSSQVIVPVLNTNQIENKVISTTTTEDNEVAFADTFSSTNVHGGRTASPSRTLPPSTSPRKNLKGSVSSNNVSGWISNPPPPANTRPGVSSRAVPSTTSPTKSATPVYSSNPIYSTPNLPSSLSDTSLYQNFMSTQPNFQYSSVTPTQFNVSPVALSSQTYGIPATAYSGSALAPTQFASTGLFPSTTPYAPLYTPPVYDNVNVIPSSTVYPSGLSYTAPTIPTTNVIPFSLNDGRYSPSNTLATTYPPSVFPVAPVAEPAPICNKCHLPKRKTSFIPAQQGQTQRAPQVL